MPLSLSLFASVRMQPRRLVEAAVLNASEASKEIEPGNRQSSSDGAEEMAETGKKGRGGAGAIAPKTPEHTNSSFPPQPRPSPTAPSPSPFPAVPAHAQFPLFGSGARTGDDGESAPGARRQATGDG
ncbi:hypothetical protein ACJZ2D_007018 [Fusarium nematophilum]